MHLYTCKNTAVHSFPQREEKQPGPFSRLDGKVSRSPFLAGCSMSQWHFCFLSRPGTGFYFLHLEKHLPVLGTLCCKYFPSLKHLSYLKRHLASPHILILIRGPQFDLWKQQLSHIALWWSRSVVAQLCSSLARGCFSVWLLAPLVRCHCGAWGTVMYSRRLHFHFDFTFDPLVSCRRTIICCFS